MADRRPGSSVKTAMSMATVGVEMGVAVLVGYLAGHWLDSRLGTDPWLMIIGFLLGVAAAFKGLWRAAKKMMPAAGNAPSVKSEHAPDTAAPRPDESGTVKESGFDRDGEQQ